MNGSTLLRTASLLVVLAALVGCRNNKQCCPPQQACQPAPQCAPPCYPPAPAYAAPPTYSYETQAPAPVVMPPPQPASTADMTARALEAERQAREAAEERANRAEEMLRIQGPPAGPAGGGWPAGAGGGESNALAFAEELRTRCDAEVVQSGSSIVVRLSDAFRSGSDQLKPDVRQMTTLNAVAEALMHHPGAQVAIVGHTDAEPIKKSRNKWSDNVHLSRARAETVARTLGDRGVGSERLGVDGRGDTEPLVYPERTSSDKARNRRVEINVRF